MYCTCTVYTPLYKMYCTCLFKVYCTWSITLLYIKCTAPVQVSQIYLCTGTHEQCPKLHHKLFLVYVEAWKLYFKWEYFNPCSILNDKNKPFTSPSCLPYGLENLHNPVRYIIKIYTLFLPSIPRHNAMIWGEQLF